MRRLVLVLCFLAAMGGCHAFGSRGKHRATGQTDPDRREAVDSMKSAEAEARKQMSNW